MAPMTKEEFILKYCERSSKAAVENGGSPITWEFLSKRRKALPCACGESNCEGWAMVPIDEDEAMYDKMYGHCDSD